MRYQLKVKPAIPVEERHKLCDLIKKLGYSIIGTGQMIDGSECDISFESKGEKDA